MASSQSSHHTQRGRDRQPSPLENAQPHYRSESRRLSDRRRKVKTTAFELDHCPGTLHQQHPMKSVCVCTLHAGDAVWVFSRSSDKWVNGEIVKSEGSNFVRVEYEVEGYWFGKTLHLHSDHLLILAASSNFEEGDPGTNFASCHDSAELLGANLANLGYDMGNLEAGDIVEVQGFQAQPHLNGQRGVVVLPEQSPQWLTIAQRFQGMVEVRFRNGDQKKLKLENLRQVQPAQTLKEFFEFEYELGLDFRECIHCGEYRRENYEGIPVYVHKRTGILIWQQALVCLPQGSHRGTALFHYTSSVPFLNIVEERCDHAELWKSIKKPDTTDEEQPDTGFGEGVYASLKEPKEWLSQDQILINNFCSIDKKWHDRAAFCVPVLVHKFKQATIMEYGAHKGWEIQNHFRTHIFEDRRCQTCGQTRSLDLCVALKRQGISEFARDVWIITQEQLSANFEDTWHMRLEAQKKILGEKHSVTLDTQHALGQCLGKRGRYQEAESIYRNILKTRAELLGSTHPDTLGCSHNLAFLLEKMHKYDEAESIHRSTLKAMEEVLGSTDPRTLRCQDSLACLLQSMGKYEEAESILRNLVSIRMKSQGPHPETLCTLNNLATCLQQIGVYDEAEFFYRNTFDGMEQLLGPMHPDTLNCKHNIARLLYLMGKYDEAESIHRSILKTRTALLGPMHPDTFKSRHALELMQKQMGKYSNMMKPTPSIATP